MSTRLRRYSEIKEGIILNDNIDFSDEDNHEGTRYYTRYRYNHDGIEYPKDNASVPDKLLLDYTTHMNYTNFFGNKFELELSKNRQRADYIEYDYFSPLKSDLYDSPSLQLEPVVIYKLRGSDTINHKIYSILKTARLDNIIKCKRPGYIYTDEIRYGSYSDEDLEELKYSGCGQDYISYDGCKFFNGI